MQRPSVALRTAVPVRLYLFDVLHLDGVSTVDLAYDRRRELLEGLGLSGSVVQVPRAFDDAERTVAAARAYGLEGVVAKRRDARYLPGRRSATWTKHPFIQTVDVTVIGYRPGEGRRSGTIGALLLAIAAPGGGLRFAGSVGSGLSDAELRDLERLLAPLHRGSPAVPEVPKSEARLASWVEPVLGVEVAFKNWSPEGRLRQPVWRGLRNGPPVRTVTGEGPAGRALADEGPETVGTMRTADGAWRIDILRRAGREWCRVVNGANIIDDLDMGQALHLLTTAGVDLADLTETDAAA